MNLTLQVAACWLLYGMVVNMTEMPPLAKLGCLAVFFIGERLSRKAGYHEGILLSESAIMEMNAQIQILQQKVEEYEQQHNNAS